MRELLPAVTGLWAGDYAHDGDRWTFPTATSCPKPLQEPHPPVWVAARDPDTYDWAVANGCNIMCWPLMRPFAELQAYAGRMEDALAKAPGVPRPKMTAMRYAAVWADESDAQRYSAAVQRQAGQFENLFKQLGEVDNGFAERIDLQQLAHRDEYRPETLREHLMFGTPDEVIEKLRAYEALGVDFLYCASYGASIEDQKRSLQLFIAEVMPAFANS